MYMNVCNPQEMEDILTSEACHSEQEAAECFVLIMCSHGSEEGLCGIDGKIIAYERISEIFNNQNCSGLAGKPKLMIYQACHGGKLDTF